MLDRDLVPMLKARPPHPASPGVVHALYVSRDGAIWAALERGLMRIETGLPISLWHGGSGVEGLPMEAVVHDERLIIASTHGAFEIDTTFPASVRRLPIPREAWAVERVGDDMLFATSDGLYARGSGITDKLADEYVYALTESLHLPGRVYMGLADGLAYIERAADGTWSQVQRVAGINEEIWSLAEDAQGVLWAGTPYRGALRVMPDSTHRDQIRWRSQLDSVVDAAVHVTALGGRAHAFSGSQVFVADTHGELRPDPVFPIRNLHVRTVAEGHNGEVWLCGEEGGKSQLVRLEPGDADHYRRTGLPRHMHLLEGLECWYIDLPDPSRMLVSTSDGVLDIRLPEATLAPASANVPKLRRWQILGTDATLPIGNTRLVELSYAERNLRFEFTLPDFHKRPFLDLDMQFRTRLAGLDDRWSEWSGNDHREYTNLWEGRYHFQVQAQDALGRISEATLASLVVLPPPHRTWQAYVLYFLIGVTILSISGWLFSRRLQAGFQKEQDRRERMLKAETAAREAQIAALRFQVNPHFLFNSLSALRERIHSAPDSAWTLVGRIADFFRFSLDTGQRQFIPLSRELDALHAYLEIEIARFGELLDASIECDDSLVDIPVPPLILQPLVENAVKYARADGNGVRRVRVTCLPHDHGVVIEVINSGNWLTADESCSSGTGTGLRNVRQRLALMYPDQHAFTVLDDHHQVVIRITLHHTRAEIDNG